MITVKITEEEYKAYRLYLKSIKLMLKAKRSVSSGQLLEYYLADPENRKEFEAGIEDVKAGCVTFIDPDNLWENIK